MRTNELVVTSHLGAPADAVWDAVTTMEGVNFELGPWLRMTAPAGVRLAAPLQRRIVRAVFRHRHDRLRQRFGACPRPRAIAG